MKKLNKFIVFVLCSALAGGAASQANAWDYENNSPISMTVRNFEDSFGPDYSGYGIQGSRMYYDNKTKDIYVMDRGLYVGGQGGARTYYKYAYDHDNMSQKNNKAIWYIYKSELHSTSFYDAENSQISENEFEAELLEYENNKDLVSVDVNEGMQAYVNNRSSKMDEPDYSNERNIILDTVNNNCVSLKAKIIIPDGINLKQEWKTSNRKIADVDSQGSVTAIHEGSCTITSEIDGIGVIEKYNITVEPYMTETEKAVKGYITSYNSGDITEKEMFNNIYALADYNAGGHVITDIDADGAYEMITRSNDMKTIKIYEISENKIVLANELTGIDKAEMVYLHGGELTQCFFRTLEKVGNNTTKVKVFQYNAPGTSMSQKFECSIKSNGTGLDYEVFDSEENKVNVFGDEYKYISKVWRESFNDYCHDVIPETNYQEICENPGNSEYGWIFRGNGYNSWVNFASNYYLYDDYYVWRSEGYTEDLNLHYVQQMAVNEILGRHNFKFSDPEVTALMNKKTDYNADASITIDQVFDMFNYYEKFNYDHINKIQFGQV